MIGRLIASFCYMCCPFLMLWAWCELINSDSPKPVITIISGAMILIALIGIALGVKLINNEKPKTK